LFSTNADSPGHAAARSRPDDGLVTTAYNLLLQRPGLDLARFAEELGCDAERATTILDRLVDLALLHRRTDEVGMLVAVSPIVAMQHLIAREQLLLHERHDFLQRSHDTFTSILRSYSTTTEFESPEPDIEQLTDLRSVRRRLEELAMSARTEVLSFSPSAYNPTATRDASRPLDMAMLGRGVRMQTLYLDTLAFEPAGLEYAQSLVQAGADVRLVPALPMRLILVDGETAIVPRDPDDDTAGALIVPHSGLVIALHALFMSYWKQGRPLTAEGDSDAGARTADRAVLRLLATGAKDEAIARQLGMSVRTVRRIVADIMVRAEVDSRFALGAYATAHNWI
jgi:DNA-binding CsgD family transcriptional regulator